jgi:putative ABC transport system permease protein
VFVLLIALSVGVGIGVSTQERGLRLGTAKAAEKFDLVVAAPGSETSMMLAAVFLQPTQAPLLDGETFAAVTNHRHVKSATPLAFGDSFEGQPVVGATAEFVNHLSSAKIDGRLFETIDEAVIGSNVSIEIGATFEPAHGIGDAAEDSHGFEITVVGQMAPTGSPWDGALVVPIESVWDTHGLSNGHAPGSDHLGAPFDTDYFPGTPLIIVESDSLIGNYQVQSQFNRAQGTMAFFPGAVLSRLYRVTGNVGNLLSAMALISQVLVATAVLLGMLILSRLFSRQLALLRTLGAPRRFVMAVVWGYANTLLILGSIAGVVVGIAASALFGNYISSQMHTSIPIVLGWTEIQILAAFISTTSVLSTLAAIPAMRSDILVALRS